MFPISITSQEIRLLQLENYCVPKSHQARTLTNDFTIISGIFSSLLVTTSTCDREQNFHFKTEVVKTQVWHGHKLWRTIPNPLLLELLLELRVNSSGKLSCKKNQNPG